MTSYISGIIILAKYYVRIISKWTRWYLVLTNNSLLEGLSIQSQYTQDDKKLTKGRRLQICEWHSDTPDKVEEKNMVKKLWKKIRTSRCEYYSAKDVVLNDLDRKIDKL